MASLPTQPGSNASDAAVEVGYGDANISGTSRGSIHLAFLPSSVNQPIFIPTGPRQLQHSSGRYPSSAYAPHRDEIVPALKVPDPTSEYLRIARSDTVLAKAPRPLLLCIDLNGTLLYRASRKEPTRFTLRPHAVRFLRYCTDVFTVVLWSSARPENVSHMCNAIFQGDMKGKVKAIWARDKFGMSQKEYNSRTQVYKRLTQLWNDPEISRSHPQGFQWDQTNTVLIDDSVEKARSEPYNLVQIPEWVGDMNETSQIPQVHDYLNWLSTQENVSAAIYNHPFVAGVTEKQA